MANKFFLSFYFHLYIFLIHSLEGSTSDIWLEILYKVSNRSSIHVFFVTHIQFDCWRWKFLNFWGYVPKNSKFLWIFEVMFKKTQNFHKYLRLCSKFSRIFEVMFKKSQNFHKFLRLYSKFSRIFSLKFRSNRKYSRTFQYQTVKSFQIQNISTSSIFFSLSKYLFFW